MKSLTEQVLLEIPQPVRDLINLQVTQFYCNIYIHGCNIFAFVNSDDLSYFVATEIR